jgi:hypothetical protein
MYTELRLNLAFVGAERAVRTFELTGQFPEAIGISDGDNDALKWAKVLRAKARGNPSIHVDAMITPGQARLYFVGTDGQIMLTTETLRKNRRDSVDFQGVDDTPEWANHPPVP